MSLPDQIFVRRAQVRQYLGVPDEIISALVEAGTLTPTRLKPNGKAWYLRSQVIALSSTNHNTPTNPKHRS